MTYIATLLHQVLVVDVALDDGVLVLDDDGDLGDLNDLDILCKTTQNEQIWWYLELAFTQLHFQMANVQNSDSSLY